MRRVILSVALVGLALGGGYVLGSVRAQPQARAQVAYGHTERSPVVIADRNVSEAELRRVVKEELAASGLSHGAESVREVAPPASSPADPAVLDDGMRRVNQAIAQRRWTPEDATALAHTLDLASPEQRATILHTLVPALNRGEVKLTYRGAVFH
jgi:hypothetical protein